MFRINLCGIYLTFYYRQWPQGLLFLWIQFLLRTLFLWRMENTWFFSQTQTSTIHLLFSETLSLMLSLMLSYDISSPRSSNWYVSFFYPNSTGLSSGRSWTTIAPTKMKLARLRSMATYTPWSIIALLAWSTTSFALLISREQKWRERKCRLMSILVSTCCRKRPDSKISWSKRRGLASLKRCRTSLPPVEGNKQG